MITFVAIYSCPLCNEFFSLLPNFFGFQGNPVGQSGLGMAYLYGRGVQVVSVQLSTQGNASQLRRLGGALQLASGQPRAVILWFPSCLWVCLPALPPCTSVLLSSVDLLNWAEPFSAVSALCPVHSSHFSVTWTPPLSAAHASWLERESFPAWPWPLPATPLFPPALNTKPSFSK